jgi:hypothetical protein
VAEDVLVVVEKTEKVDAVRVGQGRSLCFEAVAFGPVTDEISRV